MAAPFDLTRFPETDPVDIYRYRDGLYAADLITAAITGFDFFTWLADHPADLATISRELGIVERPADVMVTLFVANGFLRREPDGRLNVTPLAREHLVSTSPWFIGPYFASLRERPVVKDFITILRTNRPANWGSYQQAKPWSDAMLAPEFATTFTAAMDCRGLFLGAAMARVLPLESCSRLLDIAGGSGVYACAVVARHAHMRAAVFERPPVDQVACATIAQRGFADRVEVIAGDMFAGPLPRGFDAHLFSNVLHDWDVPAVRTLIAASFTALEPGGWLIIHDAHLNADKTGPLPVAAYSALLMSITEGKCYAVSELEALLTAIGFRDVRFTPTVADRSIITAVKPSGR